MKTPAVTAQWRQVYWFAPLAQSDVSRRPRGLAGGLGILCPSQYCKSVKCAVNFLLQAEQAAVAVPDVAQAPARTKVKEMKMTRPLPIWHLEPANSSSRLLVFQGNDLVYPGEAMESAFFGHDASHLGRFEAEPLLVAEWQGAHIYAATLTDPVKADLPKKPLRAVLTEESPGFAALASTAMQLLHWQRDNRYCGRCGGATRPHERERAFYCESCNHRLFPRLSPCVIVAIQRRGKVLLAQSHRAAGQFFSLIAGFIEPGESAEEAVHREVAEETGLEVTNLRYTESQSWAFPHQLMLGYLADYQAGDLVLEEAEIAAAGWFDHHDLPAVPGEWTIAGRLIRSALEDPR